MFPEDVMAEIINNSTKSANAVSLELGNDRSFVRLSKGRDGVHLGTIADIADVCGMDVVIIDRKTKKRICKVDAPRNRK